MGINEELIEWISKCPTAFQTVENIKDELVSLGAYSLSEEEGFELKCGCTYVVTRNMSSLIAFSVPEKPEYFKLTASHGDSPAFRVKEKAGMASSGYIRLNTEGYGGMIDSSWFDRPLSLAGRLLINRKDSVGVRLYNADRELCLIPNLAIHMNREINSGYKYNHQRDMLPLFAMSEETDIFKLLSEGTDLLPEDILACDLSLYNRERGVVWGAGSEFISAPRLDDLACVFACLKGFEDSMGEPYGRAVNVLCVFDNEEVGSRTGQGADSQFLADTLRRAAAALNMDYEAACRKSFMISADNAHALHPNYPEKTDPTNRPVLNGGIVIKYNASQRYMTDAFSAAVMKKLCEAAEAPYQTYFNRSDMPGGSTLGNLAASHASIMGVDIGLAQLAMHSAYETMGARDEEALIRAMRTYYKSGLAISEAGFKLYMKE